MSPQLKSSITTPTNHIVTQATHALSRGTQHSASNSTASYSASNFNYSFTMQITNYTIVDNLINFNNTNTTNTFLNTTITNLTQPPDNGGNPGDRSEDHVMEDYNGHVMMIPMGFPNSVICDSLIGVILLLCLLVGAPGNLLALR